MTTVSEYYKLEQENKRLKEELVAKSLADSIVIAKYKQKLEVLSNAK